KVPYGERSNEVIEPYLTHQWYVDAKTLAQPALEAVREGETVFIPENWRNVYFQWLENIQPWCISRQLWWGHRIPAWYHIKNPTGDEFVVDLTAINAVPFGRVRDESPHEFIVAMDESAALKAARSKFPGFRVQIVENAREAAVLLQQKNIIGL